MNNELYHYGVPGMKWGIRRAKKYANKAQQSRDSAKEWDEMAGYADAKGKTKAAAKYRSNAEKARLNADAFDAKATSIAGMKVTPDMGNNKRTSAGRSVAKGVLKTAGTIAISAAVVTAGINIAKYKAGKTLMYILGVDD